MHYPKISIITPCYNMVNFLEETILSVLDQNYPNLEYIIIDGGSTDGSVEIIKKYESRLSYWVSEPDKGMYDAIQKGFSKASGDIYAWINSDDKYFSWTLQTVASVFSSFATLDWLISLRPGHIDYTGQLALIGELHIVNRESFFNAWNIPNGKIGCIQQESSFWKSDLYKKVNGLDTSLRLAGDFDLWAKFMRETEPCGINLPLAQFRKTPNQLSSNLGAYMKEVNSSLQKNKMDVRKLLLESEDEMVSLSLKERLLFRLNLKIRKKKVYNFTSMQVVERKYIACEPHWELKKKSYNF